MTAGHFVSNAFPLSHLCRSEFDPNQIRPVLFIASKHLPGQTLASDNVFPHRASE